MTVKGVIKDYDGEPLISVAVREEGTQNGTYTDLDGNFSLEVKKGSCILISYIGFKEKRILCTNDQDIDIILEIDKKLLEEVVVVGYGTQKKVNLTGAIDQVTDEKLKDRPIVNLSQGLQGIVPNLNIETSSEPNSSSRINIRGMTSFNQSQPLVLVDNVQMSIDQVNPNDVESISVLKDASSAAIYGARAAYGVILITTKSGKKSDRPIVSVSAQGYWQVPSTKPKLVNSMQFLNIVDDAHINSGGAGHYYNAKVYEMAELYFNDPANNSSVFFDPELDPIKYQYVGNTDWWSKIYKSSSFSQQYNASISGGNERTTYYGSFSFNDVDGLYKYGDENFKRFNAALNVSTQITDWIKFSGKISYIYGKNQAPSNGNNGFTPGGAYYSPETVSPLMPPYHPDGNYSGQGRYINPIAIQKEAGRAELKSNNTLLTAALQLTPIEGLLVNIDYSFHNSSYNNQQYSKSFYEHNAVPGKEQIFARTSPNGISLTNSESYHNTFNAFAEYTKTLVDAHNIKALIGYNQEYLHSKYFLAGRNDLIVQDIPSLDLASGDKTVRSNETHYSINGLFMRLNYDYKNRYLVEFNGRYDGSSKFPSGDRYKFFPSGALGWRISQEPFWMNTKALEWWTDFKIRVSYGSLGNQNVVDDFSYLPKYNVTESDNIFGSTLPKAIIAPPLVSGSITWETVNQLNLGIDASFLNHRLSLGVDIYNRKTKDMLWNGQPLPAVLGAAVPKENGADLETKGFELTLGWTDQLKNGLSYWANFTLGDSKTTITKVNNPTKILSQFYSGQRYGEIWGLRSNGLFESKEDVKNSPKQTLIGDNWGPGDVKYEDLDGDGKITYGNLTYDEHGDYTVIGNNSPRFNFGISMGLEYKGFDLSMLWQGIMKRDYFISDYSFWGLDNILNEQTPINSPHTFTLDYWTPENTGAYYPRPRWDSRANRFPSDRYLQDASYIRLKTLDLGYTLPKQWISTLHIQKARLFVSMENLLTFSDLPKAFDPESVTTESYPTPRKVSLGFNLTF